MVRSSFLYFDKIYSNKPAICAEIGVKEGYNALHMMMKKPDSFFFLVDPYEPYDTESEVEKHIQYQTGCYAIMQRHLEDCHNQWCLIKKPSCLAAHIFPDRMFDYVYIDGDHSPAGIRTDIQSWLPKVKVGGILAGHDYDRLNQDILSMLPDVSSDLKNTNSDWWYLKIKEISDES